MKLIGALILVFSFNLVASEIKKVAKKVTERKVIVKDEKKAMDCDKTKENQDEFLKKIEAEKKARAEEGKGFSLQGSKDTGCSL